MWAVRLPQCIVYMRVFHLEPSAVVTGVDVDREDMSVGYVSIRVECGEEQWANIASKILRGEDRFVGYYHPSGRMSGKRLPHWHIFVLVDHKRVAERLRKRFNESKSGSYARTCVTHRSDGLLDSLQCAMRDAECMKEMNMQVWINVAQANANKKHVYAQVVAAQKEGEIETLKREMQEMARTMKKTKARLRIVEDDNMALAEGMALLTKRLKTLEDIPVI